MSESFQNYHEKVLKKPKPPLKESQLPREKESGEMVIYQGHSSEEYLKYIEAIHGPEAREAFQTVLKFCEEIQSAGGCALLVGGSVRDEIMGIASKDFDIEVYGLEPDVVEKILETHGKVDAVGRAFGILKLSKAGIDLDVSFPRRDSKVGEGHRGFEVAIDATMSIKDAARRRDFTFNALAKDPLTGEIFDPFQGVPDLQSRTLRVTDPVLFQDDPLRILRGAQFIARLGLHAESASHELMSSMVSKLRELPKERIKEEWEKLLLRSERPSIGLLHLDSLKVIDELYPELTALKGTDQEFDWHPEGDVWIHTLMVLDATAEVCREHRLDPETKRVVMWAALCHDLGKPATTVFEEGKIRSRGHEPAGKEPARALLEKIGLDKQTIDKIISIVVEHLWPGMAFINHGKGEDVGDGAFRRLAKRIAPATIAELTYIAEADSRGRGPFLDSEHIEQLLLPNAYEAGEWVRKRAVELGVEKEKPVPVLMGRDLIAIGLKPGMEFGRIIGLADDLRDEKGLSREEILALLLEERTAEKIVERFLLVLAS